MNRAWLLFSMAALLGVVVWLGHAAPTLAQEHPLVVDGQVVNATPGGGDTSGLAVVLHQQGLSISRTLETVTGGEGAFRFDDVVFDASVAYGLSVMYQGALYWKDLNLSEGSSTPVSLEVYDAVDSTEVLHATSVSVVLAQAEIDSQTILAMEITQVVNNTSFTYVPGPEPMNLLRFALPPGAQDLQVDSGLLDAEFLQVDRGFALLTSVPPGQHQVMYTYRFPYSGEEATFTKSLLYGAQDLRILAPEDSGTLSSAQLEGPESVTIGERSYQLLQASDLPRGARISVDMQVLAQMPQADRLGGWVDGVRFEYVGPTALGLLMVIVLGYALGRRARGLGSDIGGVEEASAGQELQVVSRMLTDLERSYRGGHLSEEEYRRRHTVLTARLASPARD